MGQLLLQYFMLDQLAFEKAKWQASSFLDSYQASPSRKWPCPPGTRTFRPTHRTLMSTHSLPLAYRLWHRLWFDLTATNPSLPRQVSNATAVSLLALWTSYSKAASQRIRLWKLSDLSEWPLFVPIASPFLAYSLCHQHPTWWKSRCQCSLLCLSQTLKLCSLQNFLLMTWQTWWCPRSTVWLH